MFSYYVRLNINKQLNTTSLEEKKLMLFEFYDSPLPFEYDVAFEKKQKRYSIIKEKKKKHKQENYSDLTLKITC